MRPGWPAAWKLARMTELVEPVPVARERKSGGPKRHKPKHINKIGSISARCKGCGTLIVMRVEWTPGPLLTFASEIITSVKTCHSCGRQLETPDWSSIKFILVNEA